jgi:hypothetical protein
VTAARNWTTATPCTTMRRPSTWPRPMRSGGGAATSRPKGSSGWNAQHLLRVASDDAATPHERQSAYAKARHELDGLMVLPAITRAGIERRIAGEIEA